MADEINLGNEKNINLENPTRDITEEVRNNFLDYAISVIVARAIPDARDGFKPVHRRIIYAMLKLSMTHDKPHKKSARIVGEVLGKYHPHGDSSVYEAMVRMAQDFSYRYPLVDGHGNFGSIDGDRAAAMRYTESRMSKIAGELVRDLEKLIVPFKDNYDGSEKEPVYLPSYFPNLLINGSSGIAVAMATNIPPHNLNEVIDAICYAAKNPACDTLALLDFIKGPDFPTGAIILGQNAFKNAYLTGKSIVKVRSKTRTEKLKSGKTAIIIEEIPYQIKKSTLLEDIADKVQSKRVQYVTDLRDESNRDGIRIVIEIKNESFAQLVLNQLFKFTNLQCSFAINLVALDNNQPRLFDLKQLIEIYISHQITMITKKAKFELDNSRAKSHIIAGLLKALEKIDAVIALIRSSKNNQEAIEKLNENLALTTIQSKAILDMKLQRLTGLEKIKLTQELLELEKNITTLTTLLGSEEKKIENLIERLEDIKAKYGDERRTEILESYEDDLIDEALIKEEISVITLSKNGYIKRVPLDTYRSQNRGGVGVKAIANTENEDDYIDKIIVTSTHSDLLFFSDKGKVFRIRTHKVPIFSRTAKGFPIVNLIEKEKNEKIQSIISIDNYENSDELFFVTRNGTVKKSKLKDFRLIRNNGKIAIKLKGQNHLVEVLKISKNNEIIIAAANGRAVRFNEDKVRSMSRTATGVKGINVAGSYVIGACSSNNANVVLSISQKGYGKLTFFSEYRLSNRGTKGVISMKTNQKTGKLQLIKALDQNYEATELLIITLKGIMIRFAVSSMRTMSRNTSGIRLIRLKDNDDKIASSETLLDSQINTENVN